ncbi:MAG: hypothetical protein ACRD1Z_07260 [Vicinamibacteria bacterium]
MTSLPAFASGAETSASSRLSRVFLAGVAWLGLSGAPDERGFWPVVLLALSVGLFLSRDRLGLRQKDAMSR